MKTTGFEMPPEMKALAEQSIEVARKAFHGYLDATEKTLGALEGAAGTSQMGGPELTRKAMVFAQENVTDSFAFIEKLMRARDSEDVVRLQSEFTKAQMDKLNEQTQVLADMAKRFKSGE